MNFNFNALHKITISTLTKQISKQNRFFIYIKINTDVKDNKKNYFHLIIEF